MFFAWVLSAHIVSNRIPAGIRRANSRTVGRPMDPSRASIAVTTYSEEGGARGMEEFFKLAERGSTPATEARARLTTVLAMTYIIAVNPLLLAVAGVPSLAAISATCPCGCHGHPHGRLLQPPLACASVTSVVTGVLFFVPSNSSRMWSSRQSWASSRASARSCGWPPSPS